MEEIIKSKDQEFGIRNNTRIKLDFADRLRVLFGKEIYVYMDITVNKEVSILDTKAKITVMPFFKHKPHKNDLVQTSTH